MAGQAATDFWKEAMMVIDMSVPARGVGEEAYVLVESLGQYPRGDVGGRISNVKAFFLMLKSYIGTSILILPKAFSDGGLSASTTTLIISGLLSIPCLTLMGKVAEHLDTSMYQYIITGTFGKSWGNFVAAMLVCSQLSCCVMNFAFLSATLRKVILYWTDCDQWVQDWEQWLFILCVVPMLLTPIVLVRKLHRLAIPVLLSDVVIILGILVMTSQAVLTLYDRGPAERIKQFTPNDIMVSVGTDLFTFEGAVVTILPIRSLMEYPEDFPKVLTLAISARMVVYIGFASVQYLTYGSNIHTTCILNVPDTMLGQFLFTPYMLAISIMFPQVFHPATRVLEGWLGMPVGSGKHDLYNKMKKNAFRFGLMTLMGAIAVAISRRLDIFTSICGGVLLIPLVFTIPCLAYRRIHKNASPIFLIMPIFATLVSIGIVVQAVLLAFNYTEDEKLDGCRDLNASIIVPPHARL
eukprot:TRINITY_DN23908_c0_g1_i1.p1 TRINITY_DN23908_c0_g1~~TRINITY_DN23908_c0_g1_i1.p1  ORF type:complete len:528 (+),score=83.19 TRINITY_DN23908_c0_g1_i1:188-1585(+)